MKGVGGNVGVDVLLPAGYSVVGIFSARSPDEESGPAYLQDY